MGLCESQYQKYKNQTTYVSGNPSVGRSVRYVYLTNSRSYSNILVTVDINLLNRKF